MDLSLLFYCSKLDFVGEFGVLVCFMDVEMVVGWTQTTHSRREYVFLCGLIVFALDFQVVEGVAAA